jgi:hypothetical protein
MRSTDPRLLDAKNHTASSTHSSPATARKRLVVARQLPDILQFVLMDPDPLRDQRPGTPWQPPIQHFTRLNRHCGFELAVDCVQFRKCVFAVIYTPA